MGKLFKKLADTVEKAAALPATQVKVGPHYRGETANALILLP